MCCNELFTIIKNNNNILSLIPVMYQFNKYSVSADIKLSFEFDYHWRILVTFINIKPISYELYFHILKEILIIN